MLQTLKKNKRKMLSIILLVTSLALAVFLSVAATFGTGKFADFFESLSLKNPNDKLLAFSVLCLFAALFASITALLIIREKRKSESPSPFIVPAIVSVAGIIAVIVTFKVIPTIDIPTTNNPGINTGIGFIALGCALIIALLTIGLSFAISSFAIRIKKSEKSETKSGKLLVSGEGKKNQELEFQSDKLLSSGEEKKNQELELKSDKLLSSGEGKKNQELEFQSDKLLSSGEEKKNQELEFQSDKLLVSGEEKKNQELKETQSDKLLVSGEEKKNQELKETQSNTLLVEFMSHISINMLISLMSFTSFTDDKNKYSHELIKTLKSENINQSFITQEDGPFKNKFSKEKFREILDYFFEKHTKEEQCAYAESICSAISEGNEIPHLNSLNNRVMHWRGAITTYKNSSYFICYDCKILEEIYNKVKYKRVIENPKPDLSIDNLRLEIKDTQASIVSMIGEIGLNIKDSTLNLDHKSATFKEELDEAVQKLSLKLEEQNKNEIKELLLSNINTLSHLDEKFESGELDSINLKEFQEEISNAKEVTSLYKRFIYQDDKPYNFSDPVESSFDGKQSHEEVIEEYLSASNFFTNRASVVGSPVTSIAMHELLKLANEASDNIFNNPKKFPSILILQNLQSRFLKKEFSEATKGMNKKIQILKNDRIAENIVKIAKYLTGAELGTKVSPKELNLRAQKLLHVLEELKPETDEWLKNYNIPKHIIYYRPVRLRDILEQVSDKINEEPKKESSISSNELKLKIRKIQNLLITFIKIKCLDFFTFKKSATNLHKPNSRNFNKRLLKVIQDLKFKASGEELDVALPLTQVVEALSKIDKHVTESMTILDIEAIDKEVSYIVKDMKNYKLIYTNNCYYNKTSGKYGDFTRKSDPMHWKLENLLAENTPTIKIWIGLLNISNGHAKRALEITSSALLRISMVKSLIPSVAVHTLLKFANEASGNIFNDSKKFLSISVLQNLTHINSVEFNKATKEMDEKIHILKEGHIAANIVKIIKYLICEELGTNVSTKELSLRAQKLLAVLEELKPETDEWLKNYNILGDITHYRPVRLCDILEQIYDKISEEPKEESSISSDKLKLKIKETQASLTKVIRLKCISTVRAGATPNSNDSDFNGKLQKTFNLLSVKASGEQLEIAQRLIQVVETLSKIDKHVTESMTISDIEAIDKEVSYIEKDVKNYDSIYVHHCDYDKESGKYDNSAHEAIYWLEKLLDENTPMIKIWIGLLDVSNSHAMKALEITSKNQQSNPSQDLSDPQSTSVLQNIIITP